MEKSPVQSALTNYVRSNKITNFSQFPLEEKLTILQVVPKAFIKRREIKKGVSVPYIEHQFAKKALNFIFGPENISVEIMSEKVDSYSEEYTDYQTKKTLKRNIHEASVTVRFTILIGESKKMIRDVKGTHKGYENKAIAKDDSVKSAISQAWSILARDLGVASNMRERDPEERVEEEREEIIAPPKDASIF
jgi:hypothetical protein